MPAQPEATWTVSLMRALAEVMISEERARAAADRELALDLARLRERIDEYGTIIDLKVTAATAHLRNGVDGLPGPAGRAGTAGSSWAGSTGPASRDSQGCRANLDRQDCRAGEIRTARSGGRAGIAGRTRRGRAGRS